ncbi:CoA-disulfide reductase [Rhodohalobacter barkolensis]|uniref:CoA-disulfide reductase n=1 Tax=Rhodohalobacter barkolensis TaxID=2053187 RepID=A0A2N0VK90_9BACT|nr:CoA-disulfide reductase [Rhodohalobacter barkolensis]PKD44612.1 CoA-disulfide reductase [Rhodohalobacter barkolensis]
MVKDKLVVIGGDAAGMSAASKVRRAQPDREIVVFERGNHTSYAACGMPYFIAGQIETSDQLIARKPEVFREKQNIDVRIRHEVIEIDTEKKRVRVKNLGDHSKFWESYDELLIATGASPIRPDFEGIDSDGIFALSTLQSGINVFDYIEKNSPKRATIIGGGYIGIEMAEALLDLNMDVTLFDMAPQVMTTMDKDMTEIISEYMIEKGVHVYLNEKLEKFDSKDGRVDAVQTDQRKIEADLVILGMGVKPNSEIAKNAGIKTGVKGAIHVDKKLRTSVEGIWAAGDCAESFHLVKQEQTWIALGTIANKHGLFAGINLSGGDIEFPGVCGTAITKFQDLEISRTGLNEQEANEMGIQYESSMIESRTRSGYYPGSDKISVKLIAEKVSGKLLGGQIVGFSGSAKRIDTIATAITAGMSAQDLVDLDLSYAPPFSPVWDPVQTAARTLV